MGFKEKILNTVFGPPEQRAAQCYKMGLKQIAKSDLIGAEYHFKSAVKLQPNSAKYLVGYGNALFAGQKFSEANVQYSKAAELGEPDQILLSNWGVVLRILGEVDKAVMKHGKAVELAPKDVNTLVNAGVTFSQAEKLQQAKDFFERALAIEPNNKNAINNLEALKEKMEG